MSGAKTMEELRSTGLESDDLTGRIIGAAMEVHKALGPGLLESAYEVCLCHELTLSGIKFRKQAPLPVKYKAITLDAAYQMDLVVEEAVVVELKAVEKLIPIHEAQLITNLKLSGFRIGLLMNFNSPTIKDGLIRRVV